MTDLVIVESSNKVDSIQGYLDSLFGRGKFKVSFSKGHIRDLPKDSLGLTAEYTPNYVFNDSGASRVRELKALVEKSQKVYLATDPDREGEAIAWHLKTVLRLNENYGRVTFQEITKTAVAQAMGNERKLNMQVVQAQETRRILDRIIGYIGTPAFTLICGEKQIAGRVQSSIVWYLVDLENKIKQFSSVLHFGVTFNFGSVDESWEAKWDTSNFITKLDPFVIDRKLAEEVSKLREFTVETFEEKPEKSSPPAPFTTPTYLRAAHVQLKLKTKRAMEIAQKLFEDGHITYIRTDSPNLSDDAIQAIREFALKNKLPIPATPRKFKSKALAQEGHEAIRPTDFNQLKVSDDSTIQAVYQMIWLRSVACQLDDATFTARIARMKGRQLVQGKEVFVKARGRKLIDQGWLRLTAKLNFSEDENEDIPEDAAQELNNPVPLLQKAGNLVALKSDLNEKRTEPPRRHSEASLIKFMEDVGIGRPSTFVSIVSKIIEHGYVHLDSKNKIHATDLAQRLVGKISNQFEFCNLKYTAELEGKLDLIAHGENIGKRLLKETHLKIETQAKESIKNLDQGGPKQYCSKCSEQLVNMTSANGKSYFKCTNLKCGHMMMNQDGIAIDRESLTSEFKCIVCESGLISRSGQNGEFFGCSGFFKKRNKCTASYQKKPDGTPDYQAFLAKRELKESKQEQGEKPIPKNTEKKEKEFNCPECKSLLQQRTGKSKTTNKKWEIWSCSAPNCKNEYWGERNKPIFDKKIVK
ncbi:type IA DNA topoisomerase [Acinetobacter baumannii]|uniref:type IA DNA topoisomerase n=2 Tax=Acinetobacter baumannii TaxID=470 RepID=UPI003858170A